MFIQTKIVTLYGYDVLDKEHPFNEVLVQANILVNASHFLLLSKAELNTGEFHLLYSHANSPPTPSEY
jgi:hypothetical protein